MPERFRLGDWEVRPAEGELCRGNEKHRLEPKVMAVLVELAARPGELLTKPELLAAVWPDTVVEEIALARSVSELRRVLEDDAKQPRYIETLPRRGYRLIVPVSSAEAAGDPVRRGVLPLAAGIAAALLGLGWLLAPAASPTSDPGFAPAAAPPRIAVLPFENLGSPEDGYFAAGMTEEVTSRLASLPGLLVISRTSANQYAGTSKSLRQIGSELDVDYVLEGSVRWQADSGRRTRVRIAPQLIRVSDDAHVWSRTYERELGDVFELQSELAADVIRELGLTLGAARERTTLPRPTGDMDAYRAYLRANEAGRAYGRMDSIHLAEELYRQAVAKDPGFARAWAELSLLHSSLYHHGVDRTEQRRQDARDAAETAVRLGPELGEAHLALGYFHYRCHRDYASALDAFAVAERWLPNHSSLQFAVGLIRRRQGDFQESTRRLRRAAELDPRDAFVASAIGRNLMSLRDWKGAEPELALAVSLRPDVPVFHMDWARARFWASGDLAAALAILDSAPSPTPTESEAYLRYVGGDVRGALALWSAMEDEVLVDPSFVTARSLKTADCRAALGDEAGARADYGRAVSVLENALRDAPDDPRIPGELGLAYAGLGEREPALRFGRQAVEARPVGLDAFDGPAYLADLARIHALLGDRDEAIVLLERLMSMPAGRWMTKVWLKGDPRFASLRGSPRFQVLIK